MRPTPTRRLLLPLLVLSSPAALAQSITVRATTPDSWTACASETFEWTYSGPSDSDVLMTLYITNRNIQQPEGFSGEDVLETISTTVPIVDGRYTWNRVLAYPGGSYALGFFSTGDEKLVNVATSVFPVDARSGTSLSCLSALDLGSSSSPSTASTPSSSARPSSTISSTRSATPSSSSSSAPARTSFSSSSAASSSAAPAPTSDSGTAAGGGGGTSPAGKIAGGVIGGLAAVALVGFFALWMRRRQARQRGAFADDKFMQNWQDSASHSGGDGGPPTRSRMHSGAALAALATAAVVPLHHNRRGTSSTSTAFAPRSSTTPGEEKAESDESHSHSHLPYLSASSPPPAHHHERRPSVKRKPVPLAEVKRAEREAREEGARRRESAASPGLAQGQGVHMLVPDAPLRED